MFKERGRRGVATRKLVKCKCGSLVLKCQIKKHRESKRHIKWFTEIVQEGHPDILFEVWKRKTEETIEMLKGYNLPVKILDKVIQPNDRKTFEVVTKMLGRLPKYASMKKKKNR